MLDDVERKVVRPAKTPYGQSQEKSHLDRGDLGKQQDRRRRAQRQKQSALQPDNRVVLDVFHKTDQRRNQSSRSATTTFSQPPKGEVDAAVGLGERVRFPRLISRVHSMSAYPIFVTGTMCQRRLQAHV